MACAVSRSLILTVTSSSSGVREICRSFRVLLGSPLIWRSRSFNPTSPAIQLLLRDTNALADAPARLGSGRSGEDIWRPALHPLVPIWSRREDAAGSGHKSGKRESGNEQGRSRQSSSQQGWRNQP